MKINNCVKCGCKKTWNGDDITCSFQDSEKFGSNWKCGIIGKIRQLCELAIDDKDHRLHYQYCDEQKYVTIKTDEIEDMGLCLWVSWYKSRGRTESMWVLDEYNKPKQPSFNELKSIIEHYNELLLEV